MSNNFYSRDVIKTSLDDTWSTPKNFFDEIAMEFYFLLDAAALQSSTLVPSNWYGPDHPEENRRDAFKRNWSEDSHGGDIWLNPPYGRTINQWMAKANQEIQGGVNIVCLVPSRTDTAWWHNHVIQHEVRFIRGRLKFGNAVNAAPFPSALVVMRG